MPTVESIEAARAAGPISWGLDVLKPPRRVLMRFILDQIALTGSFPSREAIREHLRWKNVSEVREALSTLCAEGHLYRWPMPGAKKRTWVYGVMVHGKLIAEVRS